MPRFTCNVVGPLIFMSSVILVPRCLHVDSTACKEVWQSVDNGKPTITCMLNKVVQVYDVDIIILEDRLQYICKLVKPVY